MKQRSQSQPVTVEGERLAFDFDLDALRIRSQLQTKSFYTVVRVSEHLLGYAPLTRLGAWEEPEKHSAKYLRPMALAKIA